MTLTARPPVIYTIGHSNHSLDRFLSLLRSHDIQMLVDVRSAPYSRYVPHFNKRSLEAVIPEANLTYLFLGRELGGRPENPDLYDDNGRVSYSRVAETAEFREAILLLRDGAKRQRLALMCSEEDPSRCHRRLLISPALRQRDLAVLHIRADGTLDTEE